LTILFLFNKLTFTLKGGKVSKPKVVIYDFDKSLKSLMSDEEIEKEFGYKPRRFVETKSAFDLFNSIHKTKEIVIQDALLGDSVEKILATKPGIDIEVLDSITAFQRMEKKKLKGNNTKLTLPQWGEIGDTVEDFITLLVNTNTSSVVIGHLKSEKDDELGQIAYKSSLSGRMAIELPQHFDCVFYTAIQTDRETKKRSYVWQVIGDERRAAKCRIDAITKYAQKEGGYIPQDFSLLFNLAQNAGFYNLKILILGDSGTGKTYSLRTLRNVDLTKPNVKVNKEAA
jgi:hypothetical protein